MLEKIVLVAYRVGTIAIILAGSAVTLMGAKTCVSDMKDEKQARKDRFKKEKERENSEDYE